MKKKLLEVAHDVAKDLHKAGAIDAKTMHEFDAWAKYYDLIHQGLDGEAEFYIGQAARARSRTLELGCGTGRICIPMAMSGCDVVGVFFGAMVAKEPEKIASIMADLDEFAATGQLKPYVSARYSLDDAPNALAALLARKVTGKVVIEPR